MLVKILKEQSMRVHTRTNAPETCVLAVNGVVQCLKFSTTYLGDVRHVRQEKNDHSISVHTSVSERISSSTGSSKKIAGLKKKKRKKKKN